MAAVLGCLRRLTRPQALNVTSAGTVHIKRFLRVDPEEEIERLFISRSFEERRSEISSENGEEPSTATTRFVSRSPPSSSSIITTSSSTIDATMKTHQVSTTTVIQRKHNGRGVVDGAVSKTPSPIDRVDEKAQRIKNRLDIQEEDDGNKKDDSHIYNNSDDIVGTSAAGLVLVPRDILSQDAHFYENNATPALSALYHYNIFYDLFSRSDIIFLPDPDVCFKVAYASGFGDDVLPVYMGNKLPAALSAESPYVSFNGEVGKYYSLLFLSLDGHLSESQAEYLHWSCVNMTSDKGIESGESTEYLQALPLRGTGYHRYVHLLIEHDVPIDVPALMPSVNKFELNSRTFRFNKFFSAVAAQCGAVPVGVKFFQSEWDDSVKRVFHHVLDMPEPSYSYVYPERKPPRQVKYPHREPFQTYLDQYRDKKEVAEEVIKEHLSEISPFKPLGVQTHPYPLARPTKPGLYADQLPASWIQDNLKHKANKTYKYAYIYKND